MRLLRGRLIYKSYLTQRLASSKSDATNAWASHAIAQRKEDEKFRGLELIKSIEKQVDEACPYPILERLGISTTGRTHSFSANPEDVVKYIKMGAINRNMAAQYCHYLAELCGTCEEEDRKFYHKKTLELLLYLLKSAHEFPHLTKVNLLCDVAGSGSSNCIKICDILLSQNDLLKEFASKEYIKLLRSCYKFGLWNVANNLVQSSRDLKIANLRLFDDLVLGLVNTSTSYSDGVLSSEERDTIKKDAMRHLLKVLALSRNDRSQFITKYNQEFIQSLERFGFKVTKNPNIKMSGRCTSCDSHIPVYDSKMTTHVNNSLQQVLTKEVEQGAGSTKLYLHMVPEDMSRFKDFIEKTFLVDKRPIDCVIDALNVSYKNSYGFLFSQVEVADNVQRTIKRHKAESQVQVLINTIIRGNMLKLFKKIVVIGKEHMRRWPGLLDFFNKQGIHYFFSSDGAKEDLLQLYAATCHPKTVLVTNDFLRDHVALLEGEERIMLERWIDTHQAWVLNKNLKTIWPTPYEKIASVDLDRGYFHVPIVSYHKLDEIAQHEPPPHLNSKMITWICVEIENPSIYQF